MRIYLLIGFLLRLILFVIFFISTLSAQDLEIKSLKYFANTEQSSFPLIEINSKSESFLTIEFDVQADQYPNLSIIFRFCNKDWTPTTNSFLANLGNNTAHNIDLERIPFINRGARYHFSGRFPNEKDPVTFPFSGKWMFFITKGDDTSVIFESGKFYVVENLITLKSKIDLNILSDKNYHLADLSKRLAITSRFFLDEEFSSFNLEGVEFVQNQKLTNSIFVKKTIMSEEGYFTWDADRSFAFTAKNIFPGKSYRQTDLRDHNFFNRADVSAQREFLEQSRFFVNGENDLFGGSIVMNYRNLNADYLNVTFSIRPSENFNEEIYLVGAFTDWEIRAENRLSESRGIFSLTKELKRGIYDYQYVVKDEFGNFDWLKLEGNVFETKREYHVFVFYRDPKFGGYDRIIGFTKIKSKK